VPYVIGVVLSAGVAVFASVVGFPAWLLQRGFVASNARA
jgi:hypothetical protein